jgi:DNA-binding transcriptional MerR regulator
MSRDILIPENAPPVVKIRDLAEWNRVSTETIRQWQKNGTLPPANRMGGRTLRWRLEDLKKHLARPLSVEA